METTKKDLQVLLFSSLCFAIYLALCGIKVHAEELKGFDSKESARIIENLDFSNNEVVTYIKPEKPNLSEIIVIYKKTHALNSEPDSPSYYFLFNPYKINSEDNAETFEKYAIEISKKSPLINYVLGAYNNESVKLSEPAQDFVLQITSLASNIDKFSNNICNFSKYNLNDQDNPIFSLDSKSSSFIKTLSQLKITRNEANFAEQEDSDLINLYESLLNVLSGDSQAVVQKSIQEISAFSSAIQLQKNNIEKCMGDIDESRNSLYLLLSNIDGEDTATEPFFSPNDLTDIGMNFDSTLNDLYTSAYDHDIKITSLSDQTLSFDPLLPRTLQNAHKFIADLRGYIKGRHPELENTINELDKKFKLFFINKSEFFFYSSDKGYLPTMALKHSSGERIISSPLYGADKIYLCRTSSNKCIQSTLSKINSSSIYYGGYGSGYFFYDSTTHDTVYLSLNDLIITSKNRKCAGLYSNMLGLYKGLVYTSTGSWWLLGGVSESLFNLVKFSIDQLKANDVSTVEYNYNFTKHVVNSGYHKAQELKIEQKRQNEKYINTLNKIPENLKIGVLDFIKTYNDGYQLHLKCFSPIDIEDSNITLN